MAVLAGIVMSGDAGPPAADPALGLPGLTPAAAREIPADYLRLYVRFGREMDIDWRFLAAIGGQESDHGRHPTAARVNRAGCVGPMQLGVGGTCGDFVGAWGVDGDGDGRVNPRAPADAIATAANGLRRGKGAPATGGRLPGVPPRRVRLLRSLRRPPRRLRRRRHGAGHPLRVPAALSALPSGGRGTGGRGAQ